MATWLDKWQPEDPQFWKETGGGIAWLTLGVTTFSLIASFATWFVMSAVVVRLPNIGFKFDKMQLFWLAAMPGLASGILRTIHSFLIPIFGTRTTVTTATFIKLIPMVWLGYAVQNPETSYSTFLVIAFLCGMGGGDFSSFMPSSSVFFPKRLQGTAMGIQAGIGNFGVSLTQFVTPWIIGFVALGAVAGGPQLFKKTDILKDVAVTKDGGVVTDVVVKNPALASAIVITKDGGVVKDVVFQATDATKSMKLDVTKNDAGVVTDLVVKKVVEKNIWLQNAAFWFIPFLIVAGILCAIFLKSVPLKASVGEQFRIVLGTKHMYFCVIIYIMTFGSFSGFAAAFPLMIKTIYGGFDGAPDPLKYAFLGPLIGSAVRFAGGPVSDKWGGSIFTQLSGIGLILGCLALIFGGYLTPTGLNQFPVFVAIMLFIFLMSGIGNFSTFRQFPIIFAYSPAAGAQSLGWTGAWAAYGPFVFASLIGASIASTGSAVTFFAGAIIFYVIASILNYWYYTRWNGERYDFGHGKTWWDNPEKRAAYERTVR